MYIPMILLTGSGCIGGMAVGASKLPVSERRSQRNASAENQTDYQSNQLLVYQRQEETFTEMVVTKTAAARNEQRAKPE